jgi:hypothetical protein
MLFKLNQLSDATQKPKSHKQLSTSTEWIKSFAGVERNSWRERMPKLEDFVETDRNFNPKTTHSTHCGLVHYFHNCWAKEIGAVLRPDMIFNAIISELVHRIHDKPEYYKYLFTDSDKKIDITVVANLFDYEKFLALVGNVVKDKEFMSIVCDTEFESDVPNAKLARMMAFASAGAPFFNYLGSMCGIPHLEIQGAESDWIKLHELVCKFKKIQPLDCDLHYSNNYNTFISKSANVIANIIYYCFTKSISDFEQIEDSAENFFSDIFHYGRNSKCGSGHDEFIVKGWLKCFYGDSDKDISNYRTHTNYVCMKNEDEDKFYCQVVSLAYSVYNEEKEVLEPHYGIVTYEILDKIVYNKLAMIQPEVDSKGRSYIPLTKRELKNIVEKGKLYDPAISHYNTGDTYVICDRCRANVTVAYGYGDNNDLCLPCVEVVKRDLL